MGVLFENLQKTSNGLSTSADSYETGKTTNKVHMKCCKERFSF